jgi:hypothetical protein
MKFIKRLFPTRKRPPADDYEQWWNARLAAMVVILGPPEDFVHHAPQPLYLGGFADVLEFRHYIPGFAYVTSDLIGESQQHKSRLGNYELIICTREKSEWAPNIISRLAKYTLEAALQPGDTMDLGDAVSEGSTISALIFAEPEVKNNQFDVGGLKAGLLLCIGITTEELNVCHQQGSDVILKKLKEQGIFPYTDLRRKTVK